MRLLVLLLCTPLSCLAQPQLPLHFDTDPGWTSRPTYLGNPAERFEVVAADGAVTLRVAEPGRGMKFELPLRPFSIEDGRYLVMRYRARNLAGGYALWIQEAARGAELLSTAELVQDGQWHVVAVDLEGRPPSDAVRSILTEVQCAGEPAEMTFDELDLVDELPPGARVIGGEAVQDREVVIRGVDLAQRLHANPDWLGTPADRYGIETDGETLHLYAEGKGKGMKWSVMLPQPVDLGQFRYVSVRYRARNTLPWSDYFLWLGSAEGGLPDHWIQPVPLAMLKADDAWRVITVPLDKKFTAVNLALQVSSAGERGEAWLDTIRFSFRRPMLDVADLLPVTTGWTGLRAPAQEFRPVDLTGQATTSAGSRIRRLGLKSWLPAGQITVNGIPFETCEGEKDVVATPADIDQTAQVVLDSRATEAFVLMAVKLPPVDTSRMGDPVPMDRFSNPERFVMQVEYQDGVVEELFPVALSNGRHEITAGVGVYCLPELRDAPVRRVGLRNRMDSAFFLVAAVTLHTGEPLVRPEPVLGLPPRVLPQAENAGVGAIRTTASGFTVENDLLRLELKTEGGIALEAIDNRCLAETPMTVAPGPLFEIGDGRTLLTSEQVAVGETHVTRQGPRTTLAIPFDGAPRGVPIAGELRVTVGDGPEIRMELDARNIGQTVLTPVVNFPLIRGMVIGTAADTWYLWTRKGGIINNAPTEQAQYYGGQYPLQVADVFTPAGGGLALLTYDLQDIFRLWRLTKDEEGVTWCMEYWPREYQPGEQIEVAPTALRAHSGDWRRALAIYRDWTRTWYRPQVPRKRWFQGAFHYQQVFAWSQLWREGITRWPMQELVNRYREYFGCLDYLHIFDFGDSRVYGRVGDYNHYEELGGLEMMRDGIRQAQEMGVPVGLYIEGYLCDQRCAWGLENVLANDVRDEQLNSRRWPQSSEHVMCPAAPAWREHLASCYRRAAEDLQPNGLYIDEYGFIGPWYTCYSREHGHPVPWPPLRGERDTTRAIRDATPPEIATLTEETPNDVHLQYQDGALGYSVTQSDPALMPHRVDLTRFVFPDFKVFQLVNYNTFREGAWDLLKWPFFNGEGFWLHGGTADFYCEDAHRFLRKAFAILNQYEDAFCSEDVEALVPTLRPTVYANRFSGPTHTVWTLFNAEYRTFRGDLLQVPHAQGTRYMDAFTGQELPFRVEGDMATIGVTVGPQGVGCVVSEK